MAGDSRLRAFPRSERNVGADGSGLVGQLGLVGRGVMAGRLGLVGRGDWASSLAVFGDGSGLALKVRWAVLRDPE